MLFAGGFPNKVEAVFFLFYFFWAWGGFYGCGLWEVEMLWVCIYGSNISVGKLKISINRLWNYSHDVCVFTNQGLLLAYRMFLTTSGL
jgi:hypothetical protein